MACNVNNIDKEVLRQQIEQGLTNKELGEYWGCGRTKICEAKRVYGLVGLSPNSRNGKVKTGKKTCNKCFTTLPVSEFYSNGYTPNGAKKYKPSCKSCEQGRVLERHRIKIRDVLEAQGRKFECELCGYNTNPAALCFHHTTPEKNFEISSAKSRSWELLDHEIAICAVLCHNCHMEIHYPI